MVVRRADILLSVSNAAQKYFIDSFGIPAGKTAILHNGIDIEGFRRRFEMSNVMKSDFGLAEDDFAVFTVANLKWEKGHKDLIHAAKELDDPSVHFFFAGDGDERKTIENLIEKSGLERQFHLIGFRSDVAELLKIADLFVLPSVSEGFGICLIEAMSVGIPIIASDAGGISEVMPEREECIFHSGDFRGLAGKIRKIKRDAGLKKDLSAIILRHAGNFSIQKMASEYVNTIDSACQRTPT
jgi:glycosyltransferase involved in cell wall biosynthesis